MEGAVLLYNLMLAELAASRASSVGSTGLARYEAELVRWTAEMNSSEGDLKAWNRGEFWSRLREINPRIAPGAVQFSQRWLELAIARPESLQSDEEARRLISDRELRLKSSLARLHNPRALERWTGESGIGRLTFRWPNAQRILQDIVLGTKQSEAGV
jgi:hypothetical protein